MNHDQSSNIIVSEWSSFSSISCEDQSNSKSKTKHSQGNHFNISCKNQKENEAQSKIKVAKPNFINSIIQKTNLLSKNKEFETNNKFKQADKGQAESIEFDSIWK